MGAPLVLFCLLSLAVAGARADSDGDGVEDEFDNCRETVNAPQTNKDFDQFGNKCDGDLDQDGDVDQADRDLLADEVNNSPHDPDRRRMAADFDADGDVDQDDLDDFDSFYGQPPDSTPGPAGDNAHKDDPDLFTRNFCQKSPFDQCMDECLNGASPPDEETCAQVNCGSLFPPQSFRYRAPYAPDDPSNLIVNPRLKVNQGESFPWGWDATAAGQIVFQNDVNRSAEQEDGSFRWYAWHSFGVLVPEDEIPIDPSRSYVLSYYMCTADSPPVATRNLILEYDGIEPEPTLIRPENNDDAMNSKPGFWQEVALIYHPSSLGVESIAPRISLGPGPDGKRGSAWIDDVAFFPLPEEGTPLHRNPPMEKESFNGTRVHVDALGNISLVADTQQLEPFFPLAVYVDWRRRNVDPTDPNPFRFYADQGFNLVQAVLIRHNRWPAIDAQEAGMLWTVAAHRFSDATTAQVEEALEAVLPYWNSLFGFYYDNEIFAKCPLHATADPGEGLAEENCLQTMWEAQKAPLETMFAFDRAQNGGDRGVPSIYLNGNPAVARAYADTELEVACGTGTCPDRRMDVTGSYGPLMVDHLERSADQRAPVSLVQVQAHTFNRYRAMAWGGIAVGAKMICTWRDWSPKANEYRKAWNGASLTLCGSGDFGFTARTTPEGTIPDGDPGTIIRGTNSGARAEILLLQDDYDSCPGSVDGATYIVHMKANGDPEANFTVGEGLCIEDQQDPEICQAVPSATVQKVPTSFVVDYMVGIDERPWWDDFPQLKGNIEALSPVIRESHWTAWTAKCHGFETGGDPSVVAQFGDNGYICGTRTHDGEGYIFVSNTWYDIDRYGAWQEQYVGKPMTMLITVEDLGYQPSLHPEFFDFETNSWEENENVTINPTGYGWFAFNLEPLGTAAIKLTRAACNDGIDNDGDTVPDYPDDPGCHSPGDFSEELDCADGLDNDHDGEVDLADSGCLNEDDPTEGFDENICFNGIDDDVDGYMDMNDPGCRVKTQGYEDPQCDNDLDDDGDGYIDLEDPECQGLAWWNDESSTTCGPGFESALLLPGLLWLRRKGWRHMNR